MLNIEILKLSQLPLFLSNQHCRGINPCILELRILDLFILDCACVCFLVVCATEQHYVQTNYVQTSPLFQDISKRRTRDLKKIEILVLAQLPTPSLFLLLQALKKKTDQQASLSKLKKENVLKSELKSRGQKVPVPARQ